MNHERSRQKKNKINEKVKKQFFLSKKEKKKSKHILGLQQQVIYFKTISRISHTSFQQLKFLPVVKERFNFQ